MDQIMACCGILCSDCLAYRATAENSEALRKQKAEQWSKMFNLEVPPEKINCLGCRSDLVMGHCSNCRIRSCCMEKQLEHCGPCGSFPCELVNGVLKHVPEAKERLEASKN